GLREVLLALLVREQRARGPLPDRPGLGELEPGLAVAAREAPMIGEQEVAALVFRDAPGEAPPVLGEDGIRAANIEPVELLAADEEYAAQHQPRDRARVRLRIRERERAAPRTPEDEPALDAEPLPQPFDVVDEMPRRVR